MEVNLIVCTDKYGGISKNGDIPWKIQEDSNYFRDTITKKINKLPNIIIMGRKTYEKMGIVKGHINIIISSTLKLSDIKSDELIYIVEDFKNLFNCDCDDSHHLLNELNNKYSKIFVCGGAYIYDEFIQLYNQNKINLILHWSIIDQDYSCDNFIEIEQIKSILDSLYLKDSYIDKTFVCRDTKNNIDVSVKFIFQEQKNINKDETKYLNIMEFILDSGQLTQTRNGFTYNKFGEMLKFDLESYPLLTTKKVFFKGVFEELMYFIKGETNSKILSDKGVKIWEKNTSKEFHDKCNLNYEEYDMGPMYGFQWRHFNSPYNGMNADYTDKGFDQLKYVLSELKNNPSSRRILMTTYNPAFASEGVLFPCHGISIQFNTEKLPNTINKYKLNISQNQRSCDYFLGVPFNIASYALLNYMVCHILNNDTECKYKYIPGTLTMFLGDYHLYDTHLIQARRQVLRIPNEFPKLKIKKNVTNIEDFRIDDFELISYDSYQHIQAEMVA